MTRQRPPKVSAVLLERLHPAPWNPRTITDERFQNLCRSIEADPDFLWRRPLLAQADGTIYAGNARYRAAEHLGLKTVPAIIEDVPDQLARERALRDNVQTGVWDDDELAVLLNQLDQDGVDIDNLGFDDGELQELLRHIEAQTGLVDPDDVPPLPEQPTTQLGDLYVLGHHRVLCGDATNPDDVARLMNGETATLMATDPPYLVDYAADRTDAPNGDWDKYEGDEQGLEFFLSFLRVGLEHLAPRAPILQWHSHRRQALVEAAWRQAGLLPHQQLIWVKARGVPGRSHFMWAHEPCLYGWLEGKMPRRRPPKTMTTVWHVDQQGELAEDHPTQKPVELFRRPIEYHTRAGEICYEPFLGSGTQLIAAEQLDRRCFGMELEPAYVDLVVSRWEHFTGQKAKKEKRK